jgi:hypothetical protein
LLTRMTAKGLLLLSNELRSFPLGYKVHPWGGGKLMLLKTGVRPLPVSVVG